MNIRLLVLAATLSALYSARAADPPQFEARFVNDADGTWLVYPTVPG